MMASSRSAARRWRWMLPLLIILAALTPPRHVSAQDTTIYVTLPDLCVRPCETFRIPVNIITLVHVVAAYQLQYVLDRPDLVYFDPAKLIETVGTVTEAWEFSGASTVGGTTIRVTGLADLPEPPGSPPGVIPQLAPQRLVYLIAHVPCDPDTFSGKTVDLTPTIPHSFVDPGGNTIEPVSITSNTITVVTTALGDLDESGYYNVVDVVRLVNCAFRSDCPGCDPRIADVNCDQVLNVQDVVRLVEHVFRGGAAPACP